MPLTQRYDPGHDLSYWRGWTLLALLALIAAAIWGPPLAIGLTAFGLGMGAERCLWMMGRPRGDA